MFGLGLTYSGVIACIEGTDNLYCAWALLSRGSDHPIESRDDSVIALAIRLPMGTLPLLPLKRPSSNALVPLSEGMSLPGHTLYTLIL